MAWLGSDPTAFFLYVCLSSRLQLGFLPNVFAITFIFLDSAFGLQFLHSETNTVSSLGRGAVCSVAQFFFTLALLEPRFLRLE